MEVFKKNIY